MWQIKIPGWFTITHWLTLMQPLEEVGPAKTRKKKGWISRKSIFFYYIYYYICGGLLCQCDPSLFLWRNTSWIRHEQWRWHRHCWNRKRFSEAWTAVMSSYTSRLHLGEKTTCSPCSCSPQLKTAISFQIRQKRDQKNAGLLTLTNNHQYKESH